LLQKQKPVTTIEDLKILRKQISVGIVGERNGEYFILDPLFERYILTLKYTAEINLAIVNARDIGEQLVAFHILQQGFIPYQSYLSLGPFDIFINITILMLEFM